MSRRPRRNHSPAFKAKVALAAIKFVILPWMDNQTERHQQLQVLTQRLDRSIGGDGLCACPRLAGG